MPILNRSNPVLDLSLTIPIDLMKGKIVQRNELPSSFRRLYLKTIKEGEWKYSSVASL